MDGRDKRHSDAYRCVMRLPSLCSVRVAVSVLVLAASPRKRKSLCVRFYIPYKNKTKKRNRTEKGCLNDFMSPVQSSIDAHNYSRVYNNNKKEKKKGFW